MSDSMKAHARYNELEKAIDAMYDRADAYEPAWMAEKCELEIEFVSLKERLEAE
jgi:hypothetical protein